MEANASSCISVMFSFSIDSSEVCDVACMVYTVMTTAVPMAPDNWRMVLFTAEPWEPNSLGKAFNPAVFNGMVMKLKPIRNIMVRTMI